MRITRPALLAAVLLLQGCALLPRDGDQPAAPVAVPQDAGESVDRASRLAAEGRWSAALDLVNAARQQHPDDPRLAEAQNQLEARWVRTERLISDQILVGDAESQLNKIHWLEKLSRARPDDLFVLSRRIYWKEALAGRLEPLTACAEFHVAHEPQLARRCYAVAAELPGTGEVEQRLARVAEQLKAGEDLAEQRRRAQLAKQRQQRAKALLGDARAAIDARDYRRALDILDDVARLQPDNREVAGLQQEALRAISPQVEALVKLGDHLYLDEQLDAAVATWQAALTLRPDDEEILARIERARTVLERLEQLRQQQNVPPPPPPATAH